jgi:hypothetical protein
MADPKSEVVDDQSLDRAIWRKWNKFIWSGLVFLVIGLVVISIGLLLNTGAYSAEGLLIGLGAIVVIIGIIRVLIGVINPLSPDDIRVSDEEGGDTESE